MIKARQYLVAAAGYKTAHSDDELPDYLLHTINHKSRARGTLAGPENFLDYALGTIEQILEEVQNNDEWKVPLWNHDRDQQSIPGVALWERFRLAKGQPQAVVDNSFHGAANSALASANTSQLSALVSLQNLRKPVESLIKRCALLIRKWDSIGSMSDVSFVSLPLVLSCWHVEYLAVMITISLPTHWCTLW